MAQSLCTAVEVTEVFHDHASVKVKLDINMLKPSIHKWPRPREIPWHQVDLAAWSLHCQEVQPVPITDPTVTMQRWLHHLSTPGWFCPGSACRFFDFCALWACQQTAAREAYPYATFL